MNESKRRNVFYSWIGFKDLNYVKTTINDGEYTQKLKAQCEARPTVCRDSEYSPMINAIDKMGAGFWNKICLFCDIPDECLRKKYQGYISNKYKGVSVELKLIDFSKGNTHSYQSIYNKTFQEWKKESDINPYFSLASGTSAMKALFLILGSLFYPNSAQYFEAADDAGNICDSFRVGNLPEMVFDGVISSLEEALDAFDSIIGNSEKIKAAKQMAARAAKTNFNVLIYGESGTGKELFARGIHDASERKDKKFHAVNCAALPPQLLESMLFGYGKGAFTGAASDKDGIFMECNGGTLFLDEIEACSPEVQAKLLRVLQPQKGESITCRKFHPVGVTKEKSSDVRIIAATNIKLDEIGDFRNDLIYRLATLPITLPPLRERREDLDVLAKNICSEVQKQLPEAFRKKDINLDDSAIKFIECQYWPGNVRELKNVLTQAIVFGGKENITASDLQAYLPFDMQQATEEDKTVCGSLELNREMPVNLPELIKRSECELKVRYIQDALKRANGVKSKAAEMLNISYQTMDNWIESLKKKGYFKDV